MLDPELALSDPGTRFAVSRPSLISVLKYRVRGDDFSDSFQELTFYDFILFFKFKKFVFKYS